MRGFMPNLYKKILDGLYYQAHFGAAAPPGSLVHENDWEGLALTRDNNFTFNKRIWREKIKSHFSCAFQNKENSNFKNQLAQSHRCVKKSIQFWMANQWESRILKFWLIFTQWIRREKLTFKIESTSKGPSLYYVSTFLDFYDPPYISINITTECQQKFPFFWPQPPRSFADVL